MGLTLDAIKGLKKSKKKRHQYKVTFFVIDY